MLWGVFNICEKFIFNVEVMKVGAIHELIDLATLFEYGTVV